MTARLTAPQRALDFPHRPDYAPDGFMPAQSNAAARAWLARTQAWPSARLALWGEAGCGKTHLLHVWAARQGTAPLSGSGLRESERLTGALAVDDADEADERALLHALNDAAEDGRPVLLAARPPPARWPTALPDLASRLRATTAARIEPAEDALLRSLLGRLLAERQLVVAEAVQDWLRLRLPRTPAALREAARLLDQAGLEAGGRITRALAAGALAAHLAPAEPADSGETDADGDPSHGQPPA